MKSFQEQRAAFEAEIIRARGQARLDEILAEAKANGPTTGLEILFALSRECGRIENPAHVAPAANAPAANAPMAKPTPAATLTSTAELREVLAEKIAATLVSETNPERKFQLAKFGNDLSADADPVAILHAISALGAKDAKSAALRKQLEAEADPAKRYAIAKKLNELHFGK